VIRVTVRETETPPGSGSAEPESGQWESDERAAAYDTLAARTVPAGERLYDAVATAIPEKSGRVLELGCGTGLLTARIRQARPAAAVTCIDSSPAMLAVARQKPALESVTFVGQDIRAPWPGGPYDAVVSMFCLFALERNEQRQMLERARRTLRRGGVCVTGAVFRPETIREEAAALAAWERFMRRSGLDPAEIRRQLAAWDGARHRIPTRDEFCAMLKTAGFTGIRCQYHDGLYGVMVGVR
jgi:tRNA (cmo5U34)-methyltransferase